MRSHAQPSLHQSRLKDCVLPKLVLSAIDSTPTLGVQCTESRRRIKMLNCMLDAGCGILVGDTPLSETMIK